MTTMELIVRNLVRSFCVCILREQLRLLMDFQSKRREERSGRIWRTVVKWETQLITLDGLGGSSPPPNVCVVLFVRRAFLSFRKQ